MGLAALMVLGIATMILPRRWAVLPFLIMACIVSPAQRIIVASLDFDFIRILVLIGWVRVFSRREYAGFRWMTLDVAMIAWAVIGTIAYTSLWGTGDAFVYKLGSSYDALGLYFYYRWVVRDWSDYKRIIISFAAISIPVAIGFLIEKSTGRNLFSVLGGVNELTVVREGKLRAQGPFTHPIIAGVFWAVAATVIASGWRLRGNVKYLPLVGIPCAIVIVFATASSTPVAALLAGAVGGAMFFVRRWLGWIRLGVVLLLITLHFVMNNPVWHLLARIDFVGGSTGWHRYFLIDNAIRHFDEWWFNGLKSTAHWGFFQTDITNQFILEGLRGGIVTLFVFTICLYLAFAYIGRVQRMAEKNTAKLHLAWGAGVALFTHSVSFIAVSYFGQISMLWYLSLATPACLLQYEMTQRAARAKRDRPTQGSPLRPHGDDVNSSRLPPHSNGVDRTSESDCLTDA